MSYLIVILIFAGIRCQNVHSLGLYRGPRLTIIMQIKRPYATSYLVAIVTFVIAVTIFNIFTVEMCITSTLTFRMAQGQICASGKAVCDLQSY